MKRMKHPQHGFHHCYDGNEEARMRLNGWVDDAPEVMESQERFIAEQTATHNKLAAIGKRKHK